MPLAEGVERCRALTRAFDDERVSSPQRSAGQNMTPEQVVLIVIVPARPANLFPRDVAR